MKNSAVFAVPNRILRDAGTDFFKTYGIGTVMGKPERINPYLERTCMYIEPFLSKSVQVYCKFCIS